MENTHNNSSRITKLFNIHHFNKELPIENSIVLNLESKNPVINFSCILPRVIKYIPETLNTYNGFNILIHDYPEELTKNEDGTYNIYSIHLTFVGIKVIKGSIWIEEKENELFNISNLVFEFNCAKHISI